MNIECCKNGWRAIQAGSKVNGRFEKSYKATEGEALAISIALDRCKYFVQGTPLTIITDHQPLIGIEKSDLTEKTSLRIFRIKERWQNYNIRIQYVCGEDNTAADALSRHIEGRVTDEASKDIKENKKQVMEECNHIKTISEEDKTTIKGLLQGKEEYEAALRSIREKQPTIVLDGKSLTNNNFTTEDGIIRNAGRL